MPQIAHLECSRCHVTLDATTPQTVCAQCAGALYVRYDLSAAKGTAIRDAIGTTAKDRVWSGMWRYSAVLPDIAPVTLGEGWTPMLPSRRYENVFLKEEGANPTGTFKARGLSLAMTMARSYGIKDCCPLRGQRRRSCCSLCRGSRNRSAHLHAQGCAACQSG